MKVQTQPCPTERELRAFVDGTAPTGDRQRIRQHLTSCAACQGVVAGLDLTQKGPANPEDADWNLTEMDPTVALRPILGVPEPEDVDVDAATEELNLGMLGPSFYPGSRGRLAQYEVVGVLGRGGMGLVLKGFDTELQRIVAIKVLAPWLAASPRARKRFAREARAAAAINDPHVVTIHAVGDTGDMPYLVMEWIPGQTLQERIRHGPRLCLLEVLRITHQVASGLQAAHRQAVIHRDIKPGNIMLVDSQARVKITDFGVAIAAEGMGEVISAERMVGTPEYMSPEQIRGEAVVSRSDLFSMGCVIHAMVAGRSPFRGANPMDTIRRVVDQPAPSLLEIEPSFPAGLAELTERLLRKDRNDRPASAQEVVEAVEALMARQPPVIGSVDQTPLEAEAKGLMGNAGKRPGRHPWIRPVLITLVLAASVLGTTIWATRPQRRAEITPPTLAAIQQGHAPAAPVRQPEIPTSPVLTVRKDGSADYASLALALTHVSQPGTTIRIMDGGEYSGPIILRNTTAHQRLTIEAAGPDRPTVIASGHKNAVITCDGVAGLTLRGLILKSRQDQFSLSIGGFCPGLTLQDLELTKADPPPPMGFWSHIWLGNGANGEPDAPILVDRCRFSSWPTGLVLQGNASGPIANVTIRESRFETKLRQLELIAPVRGIRIVGNLFLDGSEAIVLDSLSDESGDVVVANNTFWRIQAWIAPTSSSANVPEMAVFNNALVESTMTAETSMSLNSFAKAGWRFHHNLVEASGTIERSDEVLECVRKFDFESRDPADRGPSFLRPTPKSVLARAGVGGQDPPYVGAVEPAGK